MFNRWVMTICFTCYLSNGFAKSILNKSVLRAQTVYNAYFYIFLAFDFCRFCVVIRFFPSQPQRPMTFDSEGFSIPDFIHYIYFPILILDSWEMPIDLLIKLYDQNKNLTLQSSKCFTSSVSNTSCQDSRMRVTFN